MTLRKSAEQTALLNKMKGSPKRRGSENGKSVSGGARARQAGPVLVPLRQTEPVSPEPSERARRFEELCPWETGLPQGCLPEPQLETGEAGGRDQQPQRHQLELTHRECPSGSTLLPTAHQLNEMEPPRERLDLWDPGVAEGTGVHRRLP